MTWIAVGAAVVGAAVATSEAYSSNKAVKKSANISQDRVNEYINQIRFNELMETEQLALQGQQTLGAVMARSPHTIGTIEAVASRIAGGIGVDQLAINEEAQRREVAAENEKDAIVAQANSQIKDLRLAGLSGGAQGFALGSGISANYQQNQAAKEMRPLNTELGKQQIALNNQTLATQSAQLDASNFQSQRANLQWAQTRTDLSRIIGSPIVRNYFSQSSRPADF